LAGSAGAPKIADAIASQIEQRSDRMRASTIDNHDTTSHNSPHDKSHARSCGSSRNFQCSATPFSPTGHSHGRSLVIASDVYSSRIMPPDDGNSAVTGFGGARGAGGGGTATRRRGSSTFGMKELKVSFGDAPVGLRLAS
jgi:hypothetical protein